MKKEVDIVALGELLIDFTEAGRGQEGMKLFEQNPGGAPSNLLTVASHMGYKTAFIGKVGSDMHGKFLMKTLKDEGIDVRAVIEDDNYFTTLAFVEIEDSGERHFSFSRKPGADTMLLPEELDKELLRNCSIFHFGSLSLTNDPSKTATLEAIKLAKEAKALISYDPNYRASLWESEKSAIEEMKKGIFYADVMKVSDEESLLLTGCKTYEDAADKILEMGVKLVAITLGKDGVLIARKDQKEIVKGFLVSAVDTTGAGDSFWGGFLSNLLSCEKEVDGAYEKESDCSFGKVIDEFEWEDLKKCATMGNAVAALCVQKRGGIPSIPEKNDVLKFLQKNC